MTRCVQWIPDVHGPCERNKYGREFVQALINILREIWEDIFHFKIGRSNYKKKKKATTNFQTKYDPVILPPEIYPVDIHVAVAVQWLLEFELHFKWQIKWHFEWLSQ